MHVIDSNHLKDTSIFDFYEIIMVIYVRLANSRIYLGIIQSSSVPAVIQRSAFRAFALHSIRETQQIACRLPAIEAEAISIEF